MYKKINDFMYSIDSSVESGSKAAEIIYEIINNEKGKALRFFFKNWSEGFADGIGMTLVRNYDINVEFERVESTKELCVFYTP